MPHEVSTFVRCESFDRIRDQAAHVIEGTGACGPQQRFEFREGLFDRIQIGAVGGQKPELRPGRFDRRAYGRLFMDREVIENHGRPDGQRRHQDLLDVGEERGVVERTIEHGGGDEAVRGEGGDHGVHLPLAARRKVAEALAAGTAAIAPEQVRRHATFVEEEIRARVPPRLCRLPVTASGGDIRPVLFGGVHRFFLR